MRMVDSSHQQLPSYRVPNESNLAIENVLHDEKTGTDDDDDDTELLGDTEISSRLGLCRSANGEVGSSGPRMENDKRLRREIANSNERRRMQSINAGFQSLKALLPRRDGEKMSKASILQQTADFIRMLQTEKDILLHQSHDLKQLLDVGGVKPSKQAMEKLLAPSCIPKTELLPPMEKRSSYGEYGMTMDMSMAPPKKRRKFENDSADEGLDMMSDAEAMTISARHSPARRGLSPTMVATSTAIAFTQTEPLFAPMVEASCCTSPILPQYGCGETKGGGVESSMVQDKLWEIEILQRQMIELRLALDRERRVRLMLEDQMRITELNRLQTLARLQSVPMIEYNLPPQPTPTNPMVGYPSAVQSPANPMRSLSPAQSLRPVSTTAPMVMNLPPGTSTTTATPPASNSLHSLPDPVPVRLVQAAAVVSTATSPKNDAQSLSAVSNVAAASVTMASQRTSAASSLSSSTSTPDQVSNLSPSTGASTTLSAVAAAAAAANGQLYGGASNSSKQSLAAIVEAIRHLEGDQLFVDVELQRSNAQQQSMSVNAVVTTTPNGGPTIVTSHCQSTRIGASAVVRPDYTDSGISSPVSERHSTNGAGNSGVNSGGASSNFAGPHVSQLMVPGQQGGGNKSNRSDGNELNHVVAATAAALHNLCFPFANHQQHQHHQQQHQQFSAVLPLHNQAQHEVVRPRASSAWNPSTTPPMQ